MINHILRQAQLLLDLVVTLKQLNCIPSLITFFHGMQRYFFDMSNGMLYCTAKLMLRNGNITGLRNLYGLLGSFCNAGSLQCGNRDNRNAKSFAQLVCMNLVTVLGNYIHHVNCNNHRNG